MLDWRPKSLCTVLLGLVLSLGVLLYWSAASFVAGILTWQVGISVLYPVLQFFIPAETIVYYSPFADSLSSVVKGAVVIWGVIIIIPLVILSNFVYGKFKENREYKTYVAKANGDPLPQPSIVVQWIKAKKEKVCPIIHYDD